MGAAGAREGEAAGTSRLGRLAAGAVVVAAAASGPPFQTGRLGGCWLGGVEGASWVAGGGASSARGAGAGGGRAGGSTAHLEGPC